MHPPHCALSQERSCNSYPQADQYCCVFSCGQLVLSDCIHSTYTWGKSCYSSGFFGQLRNLKLYVSQKAKDVFWCRRCGVCVLASFGSVTDAFKLGGLKRQKCILSPFWRPEVWSLPGPCSLGALAERPFPASSCIRWAESSSLCLYLHMVFSSVRLYLHPLLSASRLPLPLS